MRLQLEATAEELSTKSEDLLEAIQQLVRPYSEDLADKLEKALPEKEESLKFPVLQELENRVENLYKEHVGAMIEEIFAVLQDNAKKSEGGLEKAGGPFIGPKGGMWADPEHTEHWDPDAKHESGGEKKPEHKKAEEKVPEFYSDDVATKKLEEIGDSLYDMQTDMHDVLDKTGLSLHDYTAWASVKGNLNKMKFLLSKYKKQISYGWGEEEYHKLGLGQAPLGSEVKPFYQQNYGSLSLPVNGFIQKPAFKDYLAYHQALKSKGFVSYDGTAWFIYKKRLADFPWKEYVQKMAEFGIKVPEKMPEPPPQKEFPKDPAIGLSVSGSTVDQVIAGILHKQVHDKLAVKRSKDGKFSFYYPYTPALNDLFSNKAGNLTGITKYNPENHARETFQLELVEEAIEKIKKLAPELEIVTEGVSEARIEKDAEIAELQKPIPEVAKLINPKYKLYPYQNECVRFLDKAKGNALIGDEMGLGKTLETLAWCAKNGKKVVVVTPRVVRRTWLQESVKFFPGYFKGVELVSSDIKKGKVPDLSDANIVTVNYESLSKFLPQIQAAGFDTIIVDESHRMKNPKAKATQSIQAVAKLPTMKHRILLSGTAIKNKKEELYTQLGLVAPGKFSKEALKYGTIGGLWMDMRSVYLARQKSLVLKDLPEKTTQIIEHPSKKGVPDLDELADLSPQEKIGRFSQMKAEIAVHKAPETLEFVKEILESSDSKVVLFSDSVEAAHYLADQLGDVALLHTGEMSLDKQEALKKEFERQDEEGNFISPKRVFVATRQSLAVGATLVAADKVVFNDLPWTTADIRQAEDRCHRIGQKNAVTVYWSKLGGNAFDENIISILKRKFELSKKVNQGQQLTKEEVAWQNKSITLNEVLAQYQGDKAGPGKTSSLGPSLPELGEQGEILPPVKEKALEALPVPVEEPKLSKPGVNTPQKMEAPKEAPKAPPAISVGTLDPLVLGAGGKIEESKINPANYDIKIPKGKPEVMAEIQDSFELHAKVREDGEHLIVTVPKSAIIKFLTGSDILKALLEEGSDVVYSSGGTWADSGGVESGEAPQSEGATDHAGDDQESDSASAGSGQGFSDVTKQVFDQENLAYKRTKKVLIKLGWKETDFLDGGPLYGWSTNQLIDLVRESRNAN
jgi:SWI/SNF-related matrix-associated actin-dependent regulator 1 of chromatin subfamily A